MASNGLVKLLPALYYYNSEVDMKLKHLLFILIVPFFAPSSLASENSISEAKLYIELTDLPETFERSRNLTKDNIKAAEVKLLKLPLVVSNDEAKIALNKYIAQANVAANEAYSWKEVEEEFIKAILGVYSYEELKNINKWLSSKYGVSFIKKQQLFFDENMKILNNVAQVFQLKMKPLQKEMNAKLTELGSK